MSEHPPGGYGATFADVYDSWYGDISDVTATVAGLSRLSEGGRVMELGIGTGRLALPLAEAGVSVVGIDASPEMLGVLRSKPGSSRLAIVVGDMARLPCADSSFVLVFAAFNTLFNLTSAAAQLSCFYEASRVLDAGGRFVVEGFVPDPDAMPTRAAAVRDTSSDRVTVITTRHERSAQVIRGEHVEVTPDEVTRRPWMIRYASPDELDDMARSVGLTLESRASSWNGDPFRANSGLHVTVYRRPTRFGTARS